MSRDDSPDGGDGRDDDGRDDPTDDPAARSGDPADETAIDGDRGEPQEASESPAVRAAARTVVDADLTVALTGAGVSVASGVPPFRGAGGVWERFDERDFSIERFQAAPAAFWADWLALRDWLCLSRADPNPAHRSLAALESAGHLDAVLTQNVDGLHQAAGSRRVVELHGNADRATCRGCGASFEAATAERRARGQSGESTADAATDRRNVRGERSTGGDETAAGREGGEVRAPRCENCGDVLKPDAVLFGERLPDGALRQARRLADDCGAMVVVGSSLAVEPAGSLPRRAVETGAGLVVVDPDPVTDLADHHLAGPAERLVPELASAATAVDAR